MWERLVCFYCFLYRIRDNARVVGLLLLVFFPVGLMRYLTAVSFIQNVVNVLLDGESGIVYTTSYCDLSNTNSHSYVDTLIYGRYYSELLRFA